MTVASHPQEEECVACYTEEEKRTETSKQVRKYDKYKKITWTISKQQQGTNIEADLAYIIVLLCSMCMGGQNRTRCPQIYWGIFVKIGGGRGSII